MIEILNALPWKAVLCGIGASLIRGVGGWFENVCDDKSEGGKEITKFEWAQLGGTVTRITIITVAAYFPLQALGLDAVGVASAGSAIVIDFLLKAWKTKKMVIEEPAKK